MPTTAAYVLARVAEGARHCVQRIECSGRVLTRREVLAAWLDDASLALHMARGLAASPHESLYWETPPWSEASLDAPYEQCVLDAPALARARADVGPFRTYMREGADVATFASLGGDATLVAPSPTTGSYAHLAEFVRTAPDDVIMAAFAALARAIPPRLDPRCWVSTSGLGVPWLHFRVDTRPKYYTHAPYRGVG